MVIEADFAKYQQRINQFLADYLPTPVPSVPLHEAMRYSVLGGGKRLRPLLIYSLGEAFGLPLVKLDQAACAVELIHAYSLIHDDLPAMDNDDWRRGEPSCHKKFGEAIALLAGDALQALAFEVLLQAPLEPWQVLAMIRVLTKAAGVSGMVGGQAIEFSHLVISPKMRETIYRLKTGSLFSASLELVGIAAKLPPEVLSALARLGDAIGLRYQLQDDICDDEVMAGRQALKMDFERRLSSTAEDLVHRIDDHFPCFTGEQFWRLLEILFREKVTENTT